MNEILSWERVLTRLDISYRTRPSGSLVRTCLFHQEKRPSLHFRPDGSFFCYGCKKQGDILTFVCAYYERRSDDPEVTVFLDGFVKPPENQLGFRF